MSERQFIYSLRQAWAMHQRSGRDFNSVVAALLVSRTEQLVSEGVPMDEARRQTSEIAKREYKDWSSPNSIPF